MLKNSLLMIVAAVVLTGCVTEYSAVYQSVIAESKWDESGKMALSHSKQKLTLFKVVDNKLYLMIQRTKVEWLINTVVSYPSWDKAEIGKLKKNHQKIKALIPPDWNNWIPAGFGEECKPQSI